MSTTSEKLRGLVEAIYTKTRLEEITWNLSDDKSRVSANIDIFNIEISGESSEQRFQEDIRYTIYSVTGDVVDTFTDETISAYSPVTISINSYFSVMNTTMEMARRQASGADKAIEKILKSLGATAVTDKPAPSFGSAYPELDDDVPF
jgi:hypothetical protein